MTTATPTQTENSRRRELPPDREESAVTLLEEHLRDFPQLTGVLDREIEFMPSPEFDVRCAADFILAPLPEEDGSSRRRKESLPKPPPGTPPYLAALYAIPLLTKRKEYHLFRKMNFLKYRAETMRRRLNPQRPDVALLDQIEASLREALEVRNQIVQANLRLVVSIAKNLVDAANSFDDLVSDGNLPLIRAVEIFDFERGTRFSTYATWAVRNSLYRSTQRGRRNRRRFLTGNEAVFNSIRDRRLTPRSRESYHNGLSRSLETLLSHLDQRDRTVVVSRFGLNGVKRPMKFREIAERLEISTERVRQLLARSLKQLHELAEESGMELEI